MFGLAVWSLAPLVSLRLLQAAPLAPRWNTVRECVTDVKIVSCDDFDCGIDGWHRIDHFTSLSENTTRWNYLFYKLEPQQDSGHCITALSVVPEGKEGPSGEEWSTCGVSAHDGVTPSGGPRIYQERNVDSQYAGEVVDLVILRPGQWTNSSEEFIRSPVNLGLGDGAGSVNESDWKEWHSITSGWVYLEYTKLGDLTPLTDVLVHACPNDSIGGECGIDLIAQGWKRRDCDLNGPTANGSKIFIFSSTAPTDDGSCVIGLSMVDEPGEGVSDVNVNDGTVGAPNYLKVHRGHGNCLTSILPLATTLDYPWPGYETVLNAQGFTADFNDGVHDSVPIYVYTSTLKEFPLTEAPKQAFNSTGGFRIAMFSDIHLTNIGAKCLDPIGPDADKCTEEWTYRFMRRVLDEYQPDMVVLNGDIYSQNRRLEDDIEWALLTSGAVFKPLVPILERNLPFAVTWGNHDAEGDILREQLQRIYARIPGYVGERGPAYLDGMANHAVEIKQSHDSDATKHKLWFFDSRSYTYRGINATSIGASGGVHKNQIDWFLEESQADEGNAMAFFHIPLVQISGSLGLNNTPEIGTHSERVCGQLTPCADAANLEKLNDDLLQAFVHSNVKATFSGHYHKNDYAINVEGVMMTFDGSAGHTAYNTPDSNYNRQMRIIDITGWGETAESYKVLDDILAGTIHQNMSEPIVTLF